MDGNDQYEKKSSQSLFLRVISLGLRYPKGFKYSDIINNKALALNEWERNIIDRHFSDACYRYRSSDVTKGDTIFFFILGNALQHYSNENDYIINIDSEFKYLDFQELQFARQNAKEAKKLSWYAIFLAILAIIVSASIPFLVARKVTQNITVDDKQFEKLYEIINSELTKIIEVQESLKK